MDDETRKNSDYDDFGGDDRISELPDDILLHILSYLPRKDIIATSLLSSRWKYLWNMFPVFDFSFEILHLKQIRGTGDDDPLDLVIPNNRARIREFCLRCCCRLRRASEKRAKLTSLVSKLVRHKVEVLNFYFGPQWRRIQVLPLPDSLFTSDSLTRLDLVIIAKINLPTSIWFPRLKTLHLGQIEFHENHEPEQLFSGCPVLEELHLDRCAYKYKRAFKDGLRISIAPLWRLIVHHNKNMILLRMNCSNLRFLELCCGSFTFSECNLPSLSEALIDINTLWMGYSHYKEQKQHLAHKTLELLERICHVKSLQLSTDTLKTISAAKNFNVDHLPTFYNMTHLGVNNNRIYKARTTTMMHILQKSPNIRHLDFLKGLIFYYCSMGLMGYYNLSLNDAIPFYLNRSLKSFNISKFCGNELEVNVRFYIPKDDANRKIVADVRFLGNILGNVDVIKKFTMELMERKVYVQHEQGRFSHTGCLYLFLNHSS